MDRTERLLDLVALLLAAKAPVSLGEVRAAFPEEYGGSDEAAGRKFERDKAELLELGIPLTWEGSRDEEGRGGYVLDREAYYLPEPGLTAEELAVLYAAGSAALESGAFPGQKDLAHALRKVGFFAEGPMPAPKVRLELGAVPDAEALPARLEVLWAAINARKSVTLAYYSPHRDGVTNRTVNPWGLALRRGVWHLVGWCHLRQDVRTFQVHRMRQVEVNAVKPKSPDFEVPKDVSLQAYVATWPWQHRIHEPMEVTIELTGALRSLAAGLFGVTPVQGSGGETRVRLSVTDLDGLVRYVVSQGPDARVVAPAKAVARTRAVLEAVLTAHGGHP